jgi:membrane protease YdiL (CAAX protease family)
VPSNVAAVARFVGVAYAISWALTLPLLLGQNGLGVFPFVVPAGLAFVLIVLQSYGPTVAAMLLSTPEQRRGLLVSMRRWGGGWTTAGLCLVGPPAAVALGSLVAGTSEGAGVLAFDPSLIVTFLVNLPVLLVLGGPLGEEAGWRGFALPRLQTSLGPVLASLVIGCIWACWHLPNFMIPQMGTWQGSVWMYLVLTVLLSLIHTAVYNRSSGSLAAVIVLHASVDASSRTLLPVAFGDDRARGAVALLVGFGILVGCVASLGWLRRAAPDRALVAAGSP